MALDKVLKLYMDKKKIGNKELSSISGVPLRTISNILSGITVNPTLETIRALAHALDCTLDELAEEMKDNSNEEIQTIAAHHDGEVWTDDELDEIEQFKKYVLSKRNK